MHSLPSTVTALWLEPEGDVVTAGPDLRLVVDPAASHERRVSLLTPASGAAVAVVSPEVADRAGARARTATDPAALRAAIEAAGIALHDADRLFFLPTHALAALREEATPSHVRRLDPGSAGDVEAFAAFEAEASPEDLDAAYVELDHWAVVGAFTDASTSGRLVGAASAYPWGPGGRLADLGVLTLPTDRGQGVARGVVRALAREVDARGLTVQYRCQLDNGASAALALSAGLVELGTWEVVAQDEPPLP